MTKETFGNRIKKLIKELAEGNNTRFAEMLGATTGNLNDWINRGFLPRGKHLKNIIEKLNISSDWLLTGEGTRYIIPSPLAGEGKGEGFIKEIAQPYGLFSDITDEERDYIKKLVKILRTKQDKTVLAIKQNIDAFLDNPDKVSVKKTKAG